MSRCVLMLFAVNCLISSYHEVMLMICEENSDIMYEMITKNLGRVLTVSTNREMNWWINWWIVAIEIIMAQLISCLAKCFFIHQFVEAVFTKPKFNGLSFCIKWGPYWKGPVFSLLFHSYIVKNKTCSVVIVHVNLFLWWNTIGKSVWRPIVLVS